MAKKADENILSIDDDKYFFSMRIKTKVERVIHAVQLVDIIGFDFKCMTSNILRENLFFVLHQSSAFEIF